ncbi:helix-turn-helix domain-containing protein [Haloplanus halobius]|uniref:helix-turn-helix domain-containing protein n=1 Tax=Haloplanus halobius TaxID=2934938 RepID=UPI00201001E3|nr:helix-turn-helix domain-containing protein [Haloplanus sp. XH21]
MKQLQLRIHHAGEQIHPMHAFEMEHERVEWAELRHWNTVFDETNAQVFRVRGDPEVFRAKLAERDATVAYSVTEAVDGVFYCCVRDRVTAADRRYLDAFARGTLVVVPPIRFNGDGTTELTLVGTAPDLDAAVNALPDGMRATVQSIGPYRRRAGTPEAGLTDRQYEAVAAAVESGYYDSPREGSVADVAREMGIAPGTAAEHLRKAEATAMQRLCRR